MVIELGRPIVSDGRPLFIGNDPDLEIYPQNP